MSQEHQVFLNAYMEHGRLTGFADTSADLERHCQALSMQDQDRVRFLNREIDANQTSLFNRQNVKSHLQALSSEGQNLAQELDLSNPSHNRKISAATLALSDDPQAWQTSPLPLEDKFNAMQLKVTLRCDKPGTQSPSLWSRRLGLLRDIAVQGSAAAFVGGVEGALAGAPAAGVGSIPGALAGASIGFLGSATVLTATYAFTPAPETPVADGVINCEVVSLLPEYFVAGNVPDRLLTPDARAAKEQAFHTQLGQQTLNHLQRLYPCTPDEARRLNDPAVLRQIGAMIAKDNEGTQVLLQSILTQQGRAEHAAARDRQEQKQEQQTLVVLLGGIDKRLAQMDAQKRAEQQAQAQAARVKRAEQAAAGLVQIGTQIKSPFLQKVGNIGGTLIGLEQALLTTAQGFKTFAEGGFSALIGTGGIPGLSAVTGCFSFLAGPIGIVSAALSLFSMFGRSKQNDGLAKALQGISQQIVAVHKEMRESFQYTWSMLNEMEQRQYERFELTLRAIDYIGTELTAHIDKLATEQQFMKYQLERGMQQLKEYVGHIADQSMMNAFGRADLASSQDFLKLYKFVVPIHTWLISTATLAVNNGQEIVPPLESEQQALWNSRLKIQLTRLTEASPLAAPLGFYHSLVASVMPRAVDGIASNQLVTPNDWLPVQRAYAELIRLHNHGIASAEPKVQQSYVDKFSTLLSIAHTNLQFISRFSDASYGSGLINQLIHHYQGVVDAMRQAVVNEVCEVNATLASRYGAGHFSLDQNFILPRDKVFNIIAQTKTESKALVTIPPFLRTWLVDKKRSEDVLPSFLKAINKRDAAFHSALMSLLNNPEFIFAHSIGIVNLVFNYDLTNIVPGGLMMKQIFNTSLILSIKGTNHVLCSGQLMLSLSGNLLPGVLSEALDNVMVTFNGGGLSAISAQVHNALPKEEELAPKRKQIGEKCASSISLLTRRALEMANMIQWIAPSCISTAAVGDGIRTIETSIQRLIASPTAEHLRLLNQTLTVYDWSRLLGRTEIAGTDDIARFSMQVQTNAMSHPLLSPLTRAVTDLQDLRDALPLWIEQYQRQKDTPIERATQLQAVGQRLETLSVLDEALQTNVARQFCLASQETELATLHVRTKNLVVRQVLDAGILNGIREEQIKVTKMLDMLYAEVKSIRAQRRELLQLEARHLDSAPKLTSSMLKFGWTGHASHSTTPSTSSISTSSHADVMQFNLTPRRLAIGNDSHAQSQLQTSVTSRIHQRMIDTAKSAHIDLPHTMTLISEIWTAVMDHLSRAANPGILFLGQTRKGKTTLINHLLGTIYQPAPFDIDNLNMGVIVAGGKPEHAKTTGSMYSETFALALYDADTLSLIDTPGSTDNRDSTDGPNINAYEVAAGIGFQLLGAKLAKLRGVALVVEMSDLVNSNIDAILTPFRKIARLMGKHSHDILANTTFIITKKELVAPHFAAIAPSRYLARCRDNLLKAINSSVEHETISIILDYFIAHPEAIIVSDLVGEHSLTKAQFQAFFDGVKPLSTQLFNFEAYSNDLAVFQQLVACIEVIKNQYTEAVIVAERALAMCQQTIQEVAAPLYVKQSLLNARLWDETLSTLEAHGYQRDSLQRQLDYAAQELKAAEVLYGPILSVRDALVSQGVATQVVTPHTSLYQPGAALARVPSTSSAGVSVAQTRQRELT